MYLFVFSKYLGLMLYSVRSLLKLSDLSDDVGYLKKRMTLKLTIKVKVYMYRYCACFFHVYAYHPHFGEVYKTFLSKIGPSLLNKGQVSLIHSHVGHTRRVAAAGRGGEHTMSHRLPLIVFMTLIVLLFAMSYFFRVSLRFLDLPSVDTVFCSLSMRVLAWTRSG